METSPDCKSKGTLYTEKGDGGGWASAHPIPAGHVTFSFQSPVNSPGAGSSLNRRADNHPRFPILFQLCLTTHPQTYGAYGICVVISFFTGPPQGFVARDASPADDG